MSTVKISIDPSPSYISTNKSYKLSPLDSILYAVLLISTQRSVFGYTNIKMKNYKNKSLWYTNIFKTTLGKHTFILQCTEKQEIHLPSIGKNFSHSLD